MTALHPNAVQRRQGVSFLNELSRLHVTRFPKGCALLYDGEKL